MRLKSQNVAGNVHDAVSFLRKTRTEEFLHSIVPLNGGSGAIIIWKFESYAGYVLWTGRLRLRVEDVATEQEFTEGGLLK